MATLNRLDLTRPQFFATQEARLAALRQAIDDGDASGEVDGDIFDILSKKHNLLLDAE